MWTRRPIRPDWTSPRMEVDLGGIAKGYAADRLTELLEGYGVSSALLSLGSSTIALMGDNPPASPGG